jgi:hypothetical protein
VLALLVAYVTCMKFDAHMHDAISQIRLLAWHVRAVCSAAYEDRHSSQEVVEKHGALRCGFRASCEGSSNNAGGFMFLQQ